MKSNLKILAGMAMLGAISFTNPVYAADYAIDPAHSFVTFRIKHLGYSWLQGRFDALDGSFTLDEDNPQDAAISIEVDTTSVNTNYAERDTHLRSADFLEVSEHPKATFESTSIEVTGDNSALVHGKLTLHGVAMDITIDATHVGGGDDPWGGYRHGFTGTTQITYADFGMPYDLGPASQVVELSLNIEGIRQ